MSPPDPSTPSGRPPGAGRRLLLHPGRWAICRLAPGAAVPEPDPAAALWSVTRTRGETSWIVPEPAAPAGTGVQRGFAALEVEGPLDFALTGVLAALSAPLADAGVPIFAVSTFDTDWLLLPADRLEHAVAALETAGHRVDGG